MHIVARNTIKDRKTEYLSLRQRAAVERIKALIRDPRLAEWKRHHLNALLDLPLN